MPTVLITGANRGLGLEFTRQYLADGGSVVATARRPGEAAALNALGLQHPGQLEVRALDVTDESSLAQLGLALRGRALDIVIANAGVMTHRGFGQNAWPDWERHFRVNTFAPLRVAESTIDSLLAGDTRKFVAVSSLLGSIGGNESGGLYAYRASKAALNAVVKSMAIDLAKRGLIVLPVHPGWVKTDLGGPLAPLDVVTSVTGLRAVIAAATATDAGRFRQYDGAALPW